jgi:hypothetical protein
MFNVVFVDGIIYHYILNSAHKVRLYALNGSQKKTAIIFLIQLPLFYFYN